MTDFRLDYISRFFQKASSKPIENYVLTRIWHKLESEDIQMIPQQQVIRREGNYAMTDAFFPQIGLHIEVNEPAHYDSPDRIEADKIRLQEIEKNTGHKLEVIDCRPNLEIIHARIDEIVRNIHSEIKTRREQGTLKPWRPNESRNPMFWVDKPILRESDDIIMRNIEDICTLFGADFRKTKNGYYRKGAVAHPSQPNTTIWWPSGIPRPDWQNLSLDNGEIITESHSNPDTIKGHYHRTVGNPEKRVVFYLQKDILGFSGYYFFGLYEIDFERSNERDGIFWRRISKEFQNLEAKT